MKNIHSVSATSSVAITLASFMIAALLSACGGGGGGAETKTGFGGTGDPTPPADALTASGPLSTVGVAGIAATGLDDRASAIFINTQAGQSFNALKLGMVAEVTGTIPATSTSTTSGTATNIIVQSAIVGSVSGVDPISQRLRVGPILVQVDQNTIFEGVTSLSALSLVVDSRVEVYGLPFADGLAFRNGQGILATRLISLPSTGPSDLSSPVELLGIATTVNAFQFGLPGVSVSISQVSSVTTPTGIVPGTSSIVENSRVRVVGNLFPPGGVATRGLYVLGASQIVAGIPIVRNDNSIIVLDGIVQSINASGRFRLNDTDVDTTAANAATVTVGSRVQVKGRKVAGVLTATDFRRIAAGERILFAVQGDIANFVSTANFTVRGESINASTATLVGGTAANLVNGRTVRIKAQATDGHLVATEVTLL